MSLTAKRPRGGKSEKASTHIGLLGTSLTIAASPDLMNLGLSSVDLPKQEKKIIKLLNKRYWKRKRLLNFLTEDNRFTTHKNRSVKKNLMLTGTPVNLLLDLGELASNVSGVTIQNWRVSVGDLSRVVQNNNLQI